MPILLFVNDPTLVHCCISAKLSSSQHCFTVDLALCRICELSCMDVSQKVDNSCMFAVHTIMIMEGLLLLSPSDCVRVKKIIVCRSKLLEMYINFNFSNTGILQFLPWVVLIGLTFQKLAVRCQFFRL